MNPPTDGERLASIESMQKQCIEGNRDRFQQIQLSLEVINRRLDDQFVSQVEFRPVRNVVYGLVGIMLVAVVGALIGLVVIS